MVSFESPHHKKLISTKNLYLAQRTQGGAKKTVEHVIRQPGQLESIHPPSRAHLRLVRDIHRRRGASAFGMRNNVERHVRRAPHAAAARIVRSAPRPHGQRVRVQLLRDVRPNPEFVSGTLRTRRIVRPDHAPAVLPATVDAIAVEVPVLSRFSIGTPTMSDLCRQVTPGRRRTRDGGVAVGE